MAAKLTVGKGILNNWPTYFLEIELTPEQLRVLAGKAISALGYSESAWDDQGRILLEPKPWLKNP